MQVESKHLECKNITNFLSVKQFKDHTKQLIITMAVIHAFYFQINKENNNVYHTLKKKNNFQRINNFSSFISDGFIKVKRMFHVKSQYVKEI